MEAPELYVPHPTGAWPHVATRHVACNTCLAHNLRDRNLDDAHDTKRYHSDRSGQKNKACRALSVTCTFFFHSHQSFQSEPLVGKLPTKLASKCCTCHANGLILKASFHWCRDKLDEELQEVDVVMGLVSINPRYSPRLIQEQAMTTPLDVMNTLVRTCNWLVYCSMCWACSPPGKLSVLVCGS
jgi:hypothetical protein